MASSPQIKYTKILINNEWVDSISGKTFPDINPSTEEEICQVQEGDKADVDKAVAAARAAFKRGSPWRQMEAHTRGLMLNKLADLIERDTDYVASLMTTEMGKPINQAKGEVGFAVSTIRYFAGWSDKITGLTVPAAGDTLSYQRIEPVGVCAAIIPWNFPSVLTAVKIAPALAAGCTLIIKPAEQTPLSSLYIGALAIEAGFPPGVVNVVPGYGPTAGAALSEHMDVDKITFTGSTEVSKLILQAAGRSNLKKVGLECGGKSPLVIFDDCDLALASSTAFECVMKNSGQICCAPTRTYVQAGIYDEFVKRCRELAGKRTVGDPFSEQNEQGPQVDLEQFNKVLDLVESGKQQGAKLECGGGRLGDKGYFVQPTIFSGVTDDMRIAKEEIFGPCMQVFKFSTTEEAIERANDTTYGLASGVFTTNVNTAIVMSNAIEAGSVWVNCYDVVQPGSTFGGYKMSGLGREFGYDGLREFCEEKTVVIKI